MPAPSVLPGQIQQGSNNGAKRSTLAPGINVPGVETLSKHKLAEGRRHIFTNENINTAQVSQHHESAAVSSSQLFPQLFPQGIQLGSIISIAGSAARSLAVRLMASIQNSDWSCIVGLANHGVSSYVEAGLKLSKTLFVDGLNGATFTRVVAECVSSVKVVLAEFPKGRRISMTEASRINRHLKQNSSLLLLIGNSNIWPEAADYKAVATSTGFKGIGEGFGRIKEQIVDIELCVRRNPSLNMQLSSQIS